MKGLSVCVVVFACQLWLVQCLPVTTSLKKYLGVSKNSLSETTDKEHNLTSPVKKRTIPRSKAKHAKFQTQKASSRTMGANGFTNMARMFASPVTAPLITAPMSGMALPPSPVEYPSSLPNMRCISSSYGSELCLPELSTGNHPPCELHDNPHPGLGPCGFPGTGIPGFHPQYPLGSRWKMTKTGYVADIMKQCLQSPLSK